MKKINILRDNKEFDRIIRTRKSYVYKDYIVYLEKNTNDIYHFGLSVGKKIGNAVTRNKVKRRLKEIISKKNYHNNFNCIIIVKKGILEKSFSQISEDLNELFHKLGIKGENK